MVLRDPPEVKQYAKRGDPPMDQWPGRVVTREDLMKAGGDPRDWFRYGHRLRHTRRPGPSSPTPDVAGVTSRRGSTGTRFWCSVTTAPGRPASRSTWPDTSLV